MSLCLFILSLLLFLFAVPGMAQQADERLDSLIRTLELQEVVVTAKKIRQSGDTISYAASSYISKNDKTLEDLLRKMPGIEIKADGQILYNGQWINEFYIEGLDMLGSNYSVATKNIDAHDIGIVQIMEDHQDVKMLQGVKRGSAPAMNIRLKQSAKGIWSSTLNGALGSQPNVSWDGAATLLNFRKKSQNISVYKTNNIGVDLRPEINAPSTFTSSYGTGILYPEKPSLSDKYAYDNLSHSLSVNQLIKLNEDKTLTFNLNYLYDKEKRESNDETTYLADSLSRYIVNESNSADIHQHFVGTHTVYKLNGKKTYLKNTLSAHASFPKGNGLINDLILQKFSAHTVSIDDILKINYKKRNGGVADASLHLNYSDREGFLHLPTVEMAQRIKQRNFLSDGAASIIAIAIPHFMFNLNGEFDAAYQQAVTALNIEHGSTPGSITTWQIGARVTPKVLWHYGQRFQWLVYVPVGFCHYNSEEGLWSYDKTFLSIRPYSNMTYKLSDKFSFSLTAIGEESMPTALSLMAQKHLVDYRTSISNPGHEEAVMNRSLKSAINASYRSVLDMLFGSVTFTYAQSRQGNASGYDITDGVISYIRLPFSTDSRIWQFDQTLSKGFFRWNSKISESFSIGLNDSEYYIGDRLREGRSKYLRARISYNASFTRWLSFDTSNELTLSKSYTDRQPNDGTKHTFANSTSLIVWPYKQLSLSPSVMFYHNNYSSSYQNNTFLNFNIEYTFGNVILSLQCSNLMDNNVFRRFSDNGIVRYSSEYRLRGRTIMFGIRIRLT